VNGPPVDPTYPKDVMQTLASGWKIALDSGNVGRDQRWYDAVHPEAQPAPVPGIIQQVFPAAHGVAWYWNDFLLAQALAPGERLRLVFGAVGYLAEVWIDGRYVGLAESGETPFAFDITAAVAARERHLLAVRVVNPANEPIDGLTLARIPHRHKVVPFTAGSAYDTGGILLPVELETWPQSAIADLHLRPDPDTGRIVAVATVDHAGAPGECVLDIEVSEAAGEERLLAEVRIAAPLAAGVTTHRIEVAVPGHRLWQLDDPVLYRVRATLVHGGRPGHRRSARCGFRDFRLIDGYFHLNGGRLFLKSAHTCNHFPIGQEIPVLADHLRRDLISAKASGFNTVRFIAGMALPAQLDCCDELGLMVIESTAAGWRLGRGASIGAPNAEAPDTSDPEVLARFDRITGDMVRRDRNHPSVVAWELLNETPPDPVFARAAAWLPQLRQLDPDRLVFLNSGRFDNRLRLGSCSNPGSGTWDQHLGGESSEAPDDLKMRHPSNELAGDFHLYPRVPQPAWADDLIRRLGHEKHPVLLSEYGIGSLFDVIDEYRHYEEAGAAGMEDATFCRIQAERLAADWRRLGFDEALPFVEDLLRESQRLNARQRTLGFDLIRGNPRLNGYNLTGLLDHVMAGEGLWRLWRGWKPGMFDAVCDGWAPLRWCLTASPLHGRAGAEVQIRVDLANEGVLAPGTYDARLRLCGEAGRTWEQVVLVRIPDPSPLAVPVWHGAVRLPAAEGRCVLAVRFDAGAAPSGGRLELQVTDSARDVRLAGAVEQLGLDERACGWLAQRGLAVAPFAAAGAATVVAVGNPPEGTAVPWDDLLARAERGHRVLFLDPALFKGRDEHLRRLGLAGACVGSWDWLYHKECVANRHPVFAGLPGAGVMDLDYWGEVIPEILFTDLPTPDATLAAAFHTSSPSHPDGYRASVLLAEYRRGSGRLLLNALALLPQLDRHPAADRLLANLLAGAGLARG
jgi:hypothetical protein